MAYKPTVCLDFDGVIHSYDRPWINATTIPDPPVPGAFEFIRKLQEAGFKVAIFSSRSHVPGGIEAMREWMLRQLEDPAYAFLGDSIGFMTSIEWPPHKPSAFLSIDDRAIQFTGVWPDAASLKSFRPWNKLF